MPFRLLPSDRDPTGLIRRLAAEQLDPLLTAGAELKVFEARKRLKKLRAVLRLCRAGLRGARAEGAALRDAAQGLSDTREAEVMLSVFRKLASEAEAPGIEAYLLGRMGVATVSETQAMTFRTAIADVRQRSEGWVAKGRLAAVLAEGLMQTRLRGKSAMQVALTSAHDVDAVHDWRKQVKDLWYQARLFHPVWPAMMDPLVQAADDLGAALGDHHDLAAFRDLLGQLDGTGALTREAAALRSRARLSQASIEATAGAEGARLFAGKPRGMAKAWLDWWGIWRNAG